MSIQCPSDRERGRIGVLPRSIKFVIRKKERHHRADVENIVLGDGCSLSLCHFFFNKQFKHLNKSQTVAVHRRAAYRKRSFSNLRQTECRRGFVSLVTEVVFLFVVLKNNFPPVGRGARSRFAIMKSQELPFVNLKYRLVNIVMRRSSHGWYCLSIVWVD